MNVVVLNGSPKGPVSVTVQYVRYLEKRFPRHAFRVFHVSQDIRRLEEDPTAWAEVIDAVRSADIVLWATPVYVLLVPGAYKRFVELLFERSAQPVFARKSAAVLTTSVRFFDHTAIAYLHAISDDLQMRYQGAYSAEMFDLLQPEERRRWRTFWEFAAQAVADNAPGDCCHPPLAPNDFRYLPGSPAGVPQISAQKILVLTDQLETDRNLCAMVGRLCACLGDRPEVVNLHSIRMLCGCVGCIQCSMDNVCAFRDVDDVYGVYQKLMAADIVIYAGALRDRFLSARWKLFWDRGFFNNHVPMLVGKQVAYLVSGPLSALPHVREMFLAAAELQRAGLAGIVTDEGGDAAQLDRRLEQLAHDLLQRSAAAYVPPPTFLGKAGRKLLRDEVWGGLRFVFPADHRYYRTHGLYDFPRRSLKTRIWEGCMRLLLHLPGFRREFRRRMKTEMIKPLVNVVAQDAE